MNCFSFELSYILNSTQILPVNIKGLAGSMATLANWLTSWVITMTANLLLDWSEGGGSSVALSLFLCFICVKINVDYNLFLFNVNRDLHYLHNSGCFYGCICNALGS